MSDISRFLPTQALQNIQARGQERLTAAEGAVTRKLSEDSLVKSIEAGLGGMKMTTFGSKVFSGIEKNASPYLKQQAGRLESYVKDEAGKAFDSAKSALSSSSSETPPIRMGGGEAEEELPFNEAPPIDRTTKPVEDGEPPTLPSQASKPSPGELAEPETAAAGEQGGVAMAASEEGGLITGTEALAGVLEATGIGAPLGLIVGAVGVGLALHKDKPVVLDTPNNRTGGGYSYQVGL